MSKIVNLTNYQLVFTTSFEHKHGVSGHLYEMIDYYFITSTNGIKSAILLSDGTTIDMFEKAIKDKYDFNPKEVDDILANTIECSYPKIIRANNLCIVDGFGGFRNGIVYADNLFLFRCSRSDFAVFSGHKTIKRTFLMQDFKMYKDRFEYLDIEVVDYVKKILWQRYKQPSVDKTNTAMLYLTTNCRALPVKDVQRTMNKHPYENYLIVTDRPEVYQSLQQDNVRIEQAPVKDVLSMFDTYIYTSTPLKSDCSPRFIVECAVFGKEIIYEIDYFDPGIQARKDAIESGVEQLMLTESDYFVQLVKSLCQPLL